MSDELLGMDVPYVLIVGIVLVLTFFMLFWYYSSYQNIVIGPTDLTETTIYNSIFLGSEDCFAFQDYLTGRVFPFELDITKFTDERFSGCINPAAKDIYSARLTLKKLDGQIVKQINSQQIHSGNVRGISTLVLVRDFGKIYPMKVDTEVWFNYK
jgi:hypothetical protein